MAPRDFEPAIAALRAVTYRLSSTPTGQLAQLVPHLANSLVTCKSVLSSTESSARKNTSEASFLIHKLGTKLSSLLQDRTIEGRWAAVVLVKSTIELGGWEVLHKSDGWVRGLLGVLGKPDPPTTKKLCIIALTRIFILTRDYPTLVREITTPSLPTFVSSCLSNVAPRSATPGKQQSVVQTALLQTVLEAFCALLPRHPNVFRTYQSQIHSLLLYVIAPSTTGARAPVPLETSGIAQRLFVLLHYCAPKTASSEEWDKSLKNTMANVHDTADKIFRAVVEDWEPTTARTASKTGDQAIEHELQQPTPDSMGLPGWTGIFAGSERMIGLLALLNQHIATSTSSAVILPIGSIADLLSRVFSLAVPSARDTKEWQSSVTLNKQVGKEERERLWTVLPDIHVAAIEFLTVLVERLGSAAVAIVHEALDQLAWIFAAERWSIALRTATYTSLIRLLKMVGPTLTKPSVDSLGKIMQSCCDDLLPADPSTALKDKASGSHANGNKNSQASSSSNADAFLNSAAAPKQARTSFDGLQTAASALLVALFTTLPAQSISASVRNRMDRTVILIQHKDAMLASVLNPSPTRAGAKAASSILPLLVRSFPDCAEVEGILRPRMPVLLTGSREDVDGADGEEVEEEEVEREEEGDETADIDVPNSEPEDLRDEPEADRNLENRMDLEVKPSTSNPSATPPDPAPQPTTAFSTKRVHPDSAPSSPKRTRLAVDDAVLAPAAAPAVISDAAPSFATSVKGKADAGRPPGTAVASGTAAASTKDPAQGFVGSKAGSGIGVVDQGGESDSSEYEIPPLTLGDSDDEDDDDD
ncbi:rRNA processing/ribosome biogenesis-domain-containing protein [Cryomyces antarcticus]